MAKDLAASVRARLLNVAKAQGEDFTQLLVRFALERILYRLSQSQHADYFLLKGALLFNLWYDLPHRATRDADLLGFGASDLESIAQTFRDIAGIAVEDGIAFDPDSVAVTEIRKEAGYAGARVLIAGEIAKARCKVQIDIGFGDAVTPGPVEALYPVLLDDLPAPRLRTYPVYTVVAEKLHAIALPRAIGATFIRRGMPVPAAAPIGLTDEFANDPSRQALWRAFLMKNQLEFTLLLEVVTALRTRLMPALAQAASGAGSA